VHKSENQAFAEDHDTLVSGPQGKGGQTKTGIKRVSSAIPMRQPSAVIELILRQLLERVRGPMTKSGRNERPISNGVSPQKPDLGACEARAGMPLIKMIKCGLEKWRQSGIRIGLRPLEKTLAVASQGKPSRFGHACSLLAGPGSHVDESLVIDDRPGRRTKGAIKVLETNRLTGRLTPTPLSSCAGTVGRKRIVADATMQDRRTAIGRPHQGSTAADPQLQMSCRSSAALQKDLPPPPPPSAGWDMVGVFGSFLQICGSAGSGTKSESRSMLPVWPQRSFSICGSKRIREADGQGTLRQQNFRDILCRLGRGFAFGTA